MSIKILVPTIISIDQELVFNTSGDYFFTCIMSKFENQF